MKETEVPQEDSFYEGHVKLIYAKSKTGMKAVASKGWKVEKDVTGLAWEEIYKNLKKVRQQIEDGTLSTLAYWMNYRMMDEKLLASETGLWLWTVKRHLKPSVFKKLSLKQKQKYADHLNIDVKQLDYLPHDDT